MGNHDRSIAVAVLLATSPAHEGGPAALLPWEDGTVLGRLIAQLLSFGARSVVVLTRLEWEREIQREAASLAATVAVRATSSPADDLRALAAVADRADGALLVSYGDVVVHAEALAGLTADPRVRTGVLAGGRNRPLAFRVQSRRGRVLSAASPYHSVRRPNASFLGILRVGPEELEAAAAAAERLAPLTSGPPPSWRAELERKAARWRGSLDDPLADDDFAPPEDDESFEEPVDEAGAPAVLSEADEERLRDRLQAAPDDIVSLLLVALVRDGVQVGTVYLRRMFWARPLSRDAAAAAASNAAGYDEDRLLLDSAVKGADGFFTTYFVSPYSRFIARWAARRGITPNQVTVASMAIGVVAAAAFATGERWGLVAGAILLQASFTADCVDGQLARYTRNFSSLGAWLDSMFDRSKEYLAFAGLAVGASRAGDPVWLLACAMLALQTVRHMSDFAYMTVRSQTTPPVSGPPLEQPLDAAGLALEARRERAGELPSGRPLGTRVLAAWRRTDRLHAVRWIKRMITFPIGERFAVISITAALWTPRTTFVALLAWGAFAFAYMHAGRVLRSVR